MKRMIVIIVMMASLVGMNISSSHAAVVKVIESPFILGLDAMWLTVATGMGHSTTIEPIGYLDDRSWIPTVDVLIVSDPYFPYSLFQMETMFEAMMAGVGVYIQSEDEGALPGNIAFEFVTNFTNTAGFSWVSMVIGLNEAKLTGPVAALQNARPPRLDMYNACEGTTNILMGVVPNLFISNLPVGYLYDEPANPFAGLLATNTDVDWILPWGPDLELMENYIDVLITDVELTKFIPFVPPIGTITLPPTGGTVTFSVELRNIAASTFTTTAWVRAFLPNGNLYPPPLAGPAYPTIPAFTTIGPFSFSVTIPPMAPWGTYFVQSVLTNGYPLFPICYDTDCFKIVKLLNGPDGVENFGQPKHIILSSGSFDQADAGLRTPVVGLPDRFAVSEAYPNPFNPSTTVSIVLNESTSMQVSVYNLQGQVVATLANGSFSPGSHTFSFDATGMASGVYFLQVRAGGDVQTQKLMLMQ